MTSIEHLRNTFIYTQASRFRYLVMQDSYQEAICQAKDPEIVRIVREDVESAKHKLDASVVGFMDALKLYEKENSLG